MAQDYGNEVRDVVTAFLRNEAGFSDESVAYYVNEALTNELEGYGREIAARRESAEALREIAKSGTDFGHLDAQADEVERHAEETYSAQIESFGTLLAELRDADVVGLENRTWDAALAADKASSGALSRGLGSEVEQERQKHLQGVWEGTERSIPSPPPAGSRERIPDFSRTPSQGYTPVERQEVLTKERIHEKAKERARAERAARAPQPTQQVSAPAARSQEQGRRALRERGMTTAGELGAAFLAANGRNLDGTPMEGADTNETKESGPELG